MLSRVVTESLVAPITSLDNVPMVKCNSRVLVSQKPIIAGWFRLLIPVIHPRLPLPNPARIGGLDLVRFGAATLVMMFHLGVVSWSLPVLSPNFGIANAPQYSELSFLRVGWVGVEIFFVLSGLVIAQSADGNSAYRFLRSRMGRLLPAVWVCSTVLLAVVIIFDIEPSSTALPNYFRSMIIHRNGPWISGVYWTLVVEIVFYAAIFLLLAINAFRHVEKFAMLLGSLSAVYLIGVSFLGWHLISKHFLAQHGCFFALGILIWLCSAKGITFVRAVFCFSFLSAGVLEICMIANGAPLDGYAIWAAPIIWLVSVGAMYFSVVVGETGNKLTAQMGLMTYPLYLLHELIGAVALRVNPWTGRFFAFLFAVVVAVGCSWAVVRIEPLIRGRLEAILDWIYMNIVPRQIAGILQRKTVPV